MSKQDLRAEVLLALQVSLLGMITANIRGITCGWDSSTITIKFIYDGDYSEDDEEICEEIVTEVVSHFPDCNVEHEIVSIAVPDSIKAEMLSAWVYMRRDGIAPSR